MERIWRVKGGFVPRLGGVVWSLDTGVVAVWPTLCDSVGLRLLLLLPLLLILLVILLLIIIDCNSNSI